MADNNLARSRNDGPDFFADGDPLAELARIVGYEERVIAKPEPLVSPSVVAERREPVFNLEDELLREFERYDAPRLDPADDLGPAEAFAAPLHEPRVFQSAPVPQEPDFALPVHETPVEPSVAAPVAEEPLFDAAQFEADLGALDGQSQQAFVDGDEAWSDQYAASEQQYIDTVVDQGFVPVSPEGVADAADTHIEFPADLPQVEAEPIAPVAYEEPQLAAEPLDLASELETSVAVPAEPLPVQEFKRKAAAFTPSFRMPLANFQSGAGVVSQPRVEPKVEPVAVAPAKTEALSFEGWTAPSVSVAASAPIASGLSMPTMGIPMAGPAEPIAVKSLPTAEPVQAKAQFSELDELLYDVDRYSSKPKVDAAVAAPAVAPVVAKPAAPLVEDVADPFADVEFELALDDLELDLADMVGEENRKGVTPVSVASQPSAAPVQSFVSNQSFAPTPVVAPVPQPAVSVAATPIAAAYAAAPVAAGMSAAPAYASAVQPQPQPVVADLDDDVPFDPALIAESDEQPEAIAELDVPVLTVEEKEEAPLYRSDFDLDIDAELASLLEAPEPAAPQSRAATAPQIAVAAAAPAAIAQAPAGQPAGQNVYADLDDFERALEEDFRRSLATPLAANETYAGEQDYQQIEDEGRASPKRWIASLAAVGLVAIVGGGAYAWLSATGPGAGANGEPVVIAADSDPVKVAPANPGGKTVPNQDKAVYDRVAGGAAEAPRQQQLISSSEEPVDVVQRTLMPETMPLEGENDMQLTDAADTSDARLLPQDGQADAQSGDPQQVMVMPRRVKTMIVRADGTLVEQEIEVPAAAATADKVAAAPARADAAAATAPQSAAPFPTAQASAQQSAGIVPVSAPADVASASTLPEAAQAPAAIEQLANPAPATATRAPVPTSRPSQQPVNVVASVSDQGNVRPAAAPAAQNTQVASAPAAATPAAAAAGGYVIQIASLPSEADAQRSYQNLSSRYGNVIGGRGVDIKAAEIAGKGTFYRVRIPAGANRAEAVALCERYRSAGGSCLVAR